MNKLVWNMFSSIKNAQLANKTVVFQKKNNICFLFLNVLWDEGLILGFRNSIFFNQHYEIYLKYNKNSNLSNISNVKILYQSNNKLYLSLKQLWKINLNQDLLILSTNKGILSLDNCKKLKVGGEPIIIIR